MNSHARRPIIVRLIFTSIFKKCYPTFITEILPTLPNVAEGSKGLKEKKRTVRSQLTPSFDVVAPRLKYAPSAPLELFNPTAGKVSDTSLRSKMYSPLLLVVFG